MTMRDRAAVDIDDVLRRPSSRRTASGTAANASLISTRSTSLKFQRARSNACRTAGTVPMPNIETRAPYRLANHGSAQLGGRRGFQCAVESPDRSANGVTQHAILVQ